MKNVFLLLLILVCAISAVGQGVRTKRPVSGPSAAVGSSAASTLPIRRVILYSNGVAYIERRGIITGDAEVDLSFKQSQVDDVLKSMVILNLGEGKIGTVSYDSSMPAAVRTAEIPFSVEAESGIDGLGGIAEVLAQMQGAKVFVSAAQGSASGSILTIEKRALPASKEGPASVGRFLVIASDAGEVSSFDLADVRSVKLLDKDTARDLNEFANATASTRRRDAKTITITSSGGKREMVVSYTIAAPIWKTTYRVVLDEAGNPFFQGWAIVDNVSDEDWQNIQLSLVSGSPVSFIQNLQKPLYRYRPVIPIPDDLNLVPQVYEDGIGSGSGFGSGSEGGSGSGSGSGSAAENKYLIDGISGSENYFRLDTSVSDALTNQTGGVQTAATGSDLGDLFEYRIANPVTVTRNRSALIPIVQTHMNGERVSIFNESARADRPMSGIMLTNTSQLTFEGGSMTVLDRDAYAGEALMERLKPTESRLISYALDLGTRVSTETTGDSRPAEIIKVVDGVFQIHYFKSEKKLYRLSNQTDRVKTVYIEHPRRDAWGLSVETTKPEIVTDKYYRFKVVLKPFERTELPVIEQTGLMESYSLASFTRQQFDLFISKNYVSDAVRTKLARLLSLRTQLTEIANKLKSFDEEVERIEADQKRLRENIEALTKTPEARTLIARYIAKAGEQESRLEEMEKLRRSLTEQQLQLRSQQATEIRDFEVK